MVEIPVKVKMPFLWGRATFTKSNWSNINLIVGPNGSGKTLLAESIETQFGINNYSVKFLRADQESDRSVLYTLETNEE